MHWRGWILERNSFPLICRFFCISVLLVREWHLSHFSTGLIVYHHDCRFTAYGSWSYLRRCILIWCQIRQSILIVEWLTYGLTNWLTEWLTNWLTNWLTDIWTDKLTDRWTDKLTDKLTDRWTDRLTDRWTDKLTDRWNDKLTDRWTDQLIVWWVN